MIRCVTDWLEEAAARTPDAVAFDSKNECVLYQSKEDRIWCFFVGTLNEKQIRQALKGRLARYMIPDVFVHLEELPHTASMKLNRAALQEMMQ